MRRLIAVLVASLLTLVVSTGVAAAHAKLESMTPADGSSMAAPPTQVVLTFNEPVGSNGTQVQVKSPSGTNVATGDVQVIDNTVTQPVGAMIEAGRYTGRRPRGVRRRPPDHRHRLASPSPTPVIPPTQPAGTPPTADSGNSNTVTIVAMCLVMLVVVALAVVIVRRRPDRRQ